MLKNLLKKYKQPLIKGFSTFTVIISVLILVKPSSIWGFCLLIASLSVVSSAIFDLIFKKKLSGWFTYVKSFGMAAFASALFYLFNRWSSAHGIWGLVIFVVLVAGYKMWKQKEFVGASKAGLETMIFGYPASQKQRDNAGLTKAAVDKIRAERGRVKK